MLVPMPSTHTINAVSGLDKDRMARVSTLVPHANEVAVAAITDIILAAFNLFPDIVVLAGRPKVFERVIAC